jgi:D-amino peptidase
MKVYMMTDLEGVAGVTDFEKRDDDTHDNWERRKLMRRLLTAEVNAAIEGLHEGGATEVIVNDGHGAGLTIDFEDLDPRARIIHGHDRPFWLPLLDETCAATVLVGAHAKACTAGATCYHTMSKVIKDWSINGVSVGEMGCQALIAGHYRVPMTFVSGEEHACREIEELVPGIVTANVKTGLSRRSAVSLAPQAARELIRQKAQESMTKIGELKPLDLGAPLNLREERFDEAFTGKGSSEHVTILDANTREVTAWDVIELFCRLYGYPRP